MHADERLDERALAGAVVADQRDDLLRVDREVRAAQRLHAPERLHHAPGLENRFRSHDPWLLLAVRLCAREQRSQRDGLTSALHLSLVPLSAQHRTCRVDAMLSPLVTPVKPNRKISELIDDSAKIQPSPRRANSVRRLLRAARCRSGRRGPRPPASTCPSRRHPQRRAPRCVRSPSCRPSCDRARAPRDARARSPQP